MNDCAKQRGERSCRSKVIEQTHGKTHTYNRVLYLDRKVVVNQCTNFIAELDVGWVYLRVGLDWTGLGWVVKLQGLWVGLG